MYLKNKVKERDEKHMIIFPSCPTGNKQILSDI